jgi:DNA-directed RNA polymerase specialized sigma24 family protein
MYAYDQDSGSSHVETQKRVAIYAAHRKHLIAVARVALVNRENAEDVVQRVFLAMVDERIPSSDFARALTWRVRSVALESRKTRSQHRHADTNY